MCNATGNPQPQITWSKESEPNPLDSIDGALTMKNVNKSDSGVYLCSASNGIGSDTIALSTVIVNCKLNFLYFVVICHIKWQINWGLVSHVINDWKLEVFIQALIA